MPTYQYACTECGHRFEQVQSFSDDALIECPQCQGRLRKLFNAVGVVFKGSGFYRNDSRETAGSGGSSSSEKPAAGSGEKAAEKSASPEKSGDKSCSTGGAEKSAVPAAKTSGASA